MEIVVLPEEERSAEIRTLGILLAPDPACLSLDIFQYPLYYLPGNPLCLEVIGIYVIWQFIVIATYRNFIVTEVYFVNSLNRSSLRESAVTLFSFSRIAFPSLR